MVPVTTHPVPPDHALPAQALRHFPSNGGSPPYAYGRGGINDVSLPPFPAINPPQGPLPPTPAPGSSVQGPLPPTPGTGYPMSFPPVQYFDPSLSESR